MKKITITMLTITLLTFFSIDVMAQTENTDSGAKILAAMTITETADLDYGTMTVPETAAEVQISDHGTIAVLSGTITLLSQAPTWHPATFDITGTANATYSITVPNNTAVKLTGAGTDMPIINFATSRGGSSTLDGSGDDFFSVGGTLQLENGQAAGTYTGTFDISVAYN